LISDVFLPALRYLISKNLASYGVTQQKIAEKLGITQAMVSKYLKSDESSLLKFDEKLRKRIDGISTEITNMILRGSTEREISEYLCRACFNLREGAHLCNLCRDILSRSEECDICMNIRSIEMLGERFEILEDLSRAIELLENSPEVVKLMPEVRMNIAMTSKNASSPEEVASVPGRLIEVMGTIRAPMKPEFGVSRHISRVLIEVMKKTGKRAICNIKFDEDVKSALKKMEMRCHTIDRGERRDDITELIGEIEEDIECIIDPGGFGIEPVAYILGDRATEVVEKIVRIAKLI